VPIGPRDEPDPGPSACVGDVTTLSSGVAGEPAGAWLVAADRSAGRSGTGTVDLLSPSPRGTSAGRWVISSCRVNGDVRLTGIRVRRTATSGKSPAAQSTRGVRPPPGCVASRLSVYCVGVALTLNCCIFICVLIYLRIAFGRALLGV